MHLKQQTKQNTYVLTLRCSCIRRTIWGTWYYNM